MSEHPFSQLRLELTPATPKGTASSRMTGSSGDYQGRSLERSELVEQAFDDVEGALEELRQALGRDFALGTLIMAGKALTIVRSARRDYARFRELEKLLTS